MLNQPFYKPHSRAGGKNNESLAAEVNTSPYGLYDARTFARNIDISTKIQSLLNKITPAAKRIPNFRNEATFTTSGGLWQELDFGPRLKALHNHEFRGYLMIEPEDFDKVLPKLLAVATKRAAQNKPTSFKWLIGKHGNGIGDYSGLKIASPRIALYADSSNDIREIMQQLVDQGWEEIETARVAACGGKVANTARRHPGANDFRDRNNKGWRSLNWNSKNGFAENYRDEDEVGESLILNPLPKTAQP